MTWASHALTDGEVSDVTAWLLAQVPASSNGGANTQSAGACHIAAVQTTYQK